MGWSHKVKTYSSSVTPFHVYTIFRLSEDHVNVKLGVTVLEYILTLIFYIYYINQYHTHRLSSLIALLIFFV